MCCYRDYQFCAPCEWSGRSVFGAKCFRFKPIGISSAFKYSPNRYQDKIIMHLKMTSKLKRKTTFRISTLLFRVKESFKRKERCQWFFFCSHCKHILIESQKAHILGRNKRICQQDDETDYQTGKLHDIRRSIDVALYTQCLSRTFDKTKFIGLLEWDLNAWFSVVIFAWNIFEVIYPM